MKLSDLKIGDHFRRISHPGACIAVVESLPATRDGSCRVVREGDGLLGYLPVGRHTQIDPGTAEVEIVPMPAPYVIGKAYRDRKNRHYTYTGHTSAHGSACPHGFTREGFGFGHVSRGGDGTPVPGALSDPTCIMGEWVEEMTGPINTSKDNTVKRTLPTVTLDQIFQALVEKKACWASAGPIALAKKLETLDQRETNHPPVDLRRLNRYLLLGAIRAEEFGWVYENLPAIRPEGLNPYPIGAALTDRIQEWENPAPPKPKLPPVTLTLDGETAAILLTVLDNVGGIGVGGHPRAAMHALRSTLHFQNVHGADIAASGSVYLSKKA